MDILKVAFSAFGTFFFLFLLTKIMGSREMSQLSVFDYVSSITIGSIAGEMAVMSTDSFLKPLAAMLVFTVLTMLISYLTCKSIKLRRFFEGHALLLFQEGKLYEKNLLKAKVDIDELLGACRLAGYYDLSEVHTVYMESNGNISILPKSMYRPVTPKDLNLNPNQNLPMPNIIIDGKIMKENLSFTGKDEKWLNKELNSYGIKDIKEVMLATYDVNQNKANVYIRLKKKVEDNIFE